MIKNVKKFFKQLFCKHEYVVFGNEDRVVFYGMRMCHKCGKIKTIV